jgi:hypothetical protein
MSTTTKNLLAAAATVVFAIAATATSVTNAFAQTTTATAPATAASTAAASNAAQHAAAGSALVAIKAEKPGLTRAQVQAEFFEARKNGTLLETEADFDVAQTKKHVVK